MSTSETRQLDTLSRERARTVFDHPLLLVAGAGTGKTSTLVARVVTWITGPGWDRALLDNPESDAPTLAKSILTRVVAITFTDAAAAEMGTRIDRALEKLAEGKGEHGLNTDMLAAPAGEIQERIGALRQEIDALQASTFHSWCRGLLATYPFEAGLSPGFTIDADGTLRARALRQAFEELLDNGQDDEVHADLIRLTALGFGPHELERRAAQLLRAGATARDLSPDCYSDPAVGAALYEFLAEALIPFQPFLGALAGIKSGKTKDVAAAISELGLVLKGDPPSDLRVWEYFVETLASEFNATVISALKRWSGGKFNKGELAALNNEEHALVSPSKTLSKAIGSIVDVDFAQSAALARVMFRVLARFEELENQQGFLGFDQILTRAESLLSSEPSISQLLRNEMDMLLVDEFQDTDSVQCAIVGRLALEGDNRPALFLVGDPKQSIYAFRGADMAAFDAFEERVLSTGGERLELSVNFRSAPEILDEVERVFDPTFERVPRLQPTFAPLLPALDRALSPAPSGSTARVEHWVGWTPDVDGTYVQGEGKMQQRLLAEGEAIAADLVRLKRADDEFQWTDAVVLLATQTQVEAILEPLRAAGIPFDVQADRSYFQRREVVDAVCAVRAALDPDDHLALVTLLRAPFVGVPDAAILPLWKSGFPDALRQAMSTGDVRGLDAALDSARERTPQDVPGIEAVCDWNTRLLSVCGVLAQTHQALEHDSLERVLVQLRDGLAQESIEGGRYLGAWRVTNLERLWRRLLAYVADETLSLSEFLRTLRNNLSIDDSDSTSVASRSTSSAVRVMTMHGSKGLEFKHVYLAQLSRGRAAGSPRVLLRSADASSPIRSAWRLDGMASPAYPVLAARSGDVESAERVRLLYVAATRAEERLVWTSRLSGDKAVAWRSAKSFDELLHIRPRTGEILIQARAAEFPLTDSTEAHWRFTSEHDRVEPLESESSATEVTPNQAAARVAQLADRRAQADVRSARPRTSGPSDYEHAPASSQASPDESAAHSQTDRKLAQRVGTLVHRLLEVGGELEDAALELSAAELWPGSHNADVILEAKAVLESAGAAGLLDRLAELEPHVVARELPYLAPPTVSQDGPVDAEAGVIDLVLRDPETGRWTVIDFKTDRVDEAELDESAAAYAPQLAAYAHALETATGGEVGQELWFLRAGIVKCVSAPVR